MFKKLFGIDKESPDNKADVVWIIEQTGERDWWIARGPRARGYERAEHLHEVLDIVALESARRNIPDSALVRVIGDEGPWTATIGGLRDDASCRSPNWVRGR